MARVQFEGGQYSGGFAGFADAAPCVFDRGARSEEHTSELQSPCNLVCRLLLEKKKKKPATPRTPTTPRCYASNRLPPRDALVHAVSPTRTGLIVTYREHSSHASRPPTSVAALA